MKGNEDIRGRFACRMNRIEVEEYKKGVLACFLYLLECMRETD